MSDEMKQDDRASQLTAERLAAERAYNDALADVDRSIPALHAVSPASARPGGHGVEALEPRWEIMREDGAGGLKALVKKLLRLPFAGALRRQQSFNQSVVTYGASVDASLAQLGEQLNALARFHHHIVQYMQKVWPLVDTNYRHQMVVESGLAAYVEAVNATNALRWETTQARDRRVAASMDEIRTTMATVQQTGAVLKRELERVLASGVPHAAAAPQSAATAPAPPPGVRTAANPDAVNAFKYVGFEDKFRGSEDDIQARQQVYLPLFDGASDVLDLGCGRGEFLAALGARGVTGRGLDINHEMVELCRGRGLDVAEGDALAYLEGLPDGSLGGLFAAQVVEHFQPGYLTRVLDAAFMKLRPGSRLVLETLNPACWSAFFDSYIRDITHAWPLHPETLKYLVTAAGFQRIDVRFLAPYAPENKLQHVPVATDATPSAVERAMIDTINANVDRLNGQLFSNRDYAVIGEKL